MREVRKILALGEVKRNFAQRDPKRLVTRRKKGKKSRYLLVVPWRREDWIGWLKEQYKADLEVLSGASPDSRQLWWCKTHAHCNFILELSEEDYNDPHYSHARFMNQTLPNFIRSISRDHLGGKNSSGPCKFLWEPDRVTNEGEKWYEGSGEEDDDEVFESANYRQYASLREHQRFADFAASMDWEPQSD